MANYLAHYTKKRQMLDRKEATLRRFIARNADEDRLLKQAAEVRDARVRVIRAKRATLKQWEREQEHFDKLTARIEQLQAVMPVAILAEFGVAKPN